MDETEKLEIRHLAVKQALKFCKNRKNADMSVDEFKKLIETLILIYNGEKQ